jgi:hypothetical protein
MPRKPDKDRQVSASRQGAGLCASCKNLPACTYVEGFSPPILHCDEYEGGGSFRRPSPRSNPSAAGPSAGRGPERLMGLCTNCAERDKCAFPRPESGVWHCEEYR